MNLGLTEVLGVLFVPMDLFAWQSYNPLFRHPEGFLSQTVRTGYQILRQHHCVLCLNPETAVLGGQSQINMRNSWPQRRERVRSNCTAKIIKDVFQTPSINLENAGATTCLRTWLWPMPSGVAEACKDNTPTGKWSRAKLPRLALG